MKESLWIAVLIASAFVATELGNWVRNLYLQHKAMQKTEASEPVDMTGIDFTYDSSGNIRKVGHELREITYRKGKER